MLQCISPVMAKRLIELACHGVISAGLRRNRLLHQAGDYAAFNFQLLPLRHQVIRWNVFFEVKKIEQLALIDCLPTHHDPPPPPNESSRRESQFAHAGR